MMFLFLETMHVRIGLRRNWLVSELAVRIGSWKMGRMWPSGKKASASQAGDTGISPCLPCSRHTSDLKLATVVATLPEDPGFESRLRWDFWGIESYK